MKKGEVEWKASAICRVWSAVEKLHGRKGIVHYGKLPESKREPFRRLAASRALSPIEVAWEQRAEHRLAALRSPYKAVDLKSGDSRGCGGRAQP